MKKIIATALIPLLLAMSACGSSEGSTGPSDTYEYTNSDGETQDMDGALPDDAIIYEVPGDNITVYTITTNDGKTCYVVGYRGGIWCEPDAVEIPTPSPTPTEDSTYE